jgi:hypothetical protein
VVRLVLLACLVCILAARCDGEKPIHREPNARPQAGTGTAPVESRLTAQPRLRILSPSPGDDVEAPFPVRYELLSTTLRKEPPLYMTVFVGRISSELTFRMRLREPSGVVFVPDHPFLSGRRDLVFALNGPNGELLPSQHSRVRVPDLLIAGSRAAP